MARELIAQHFDASASVTRRIAQLLERRKQQLLVHKRTADLHTG